MSSTLMTMLPTIPLETIGTPEPLWCAAFLEPLIATPLDDGKNWAILEGFNFESATLGRMILVKAGEVTDFASIPRLLWTLVGGPIGKYTKPSALHDHCYRIPCVCTRKQADLVLLEAMNVMKVGWWTKWLVYLGVRIGGGASYQGGL